MLAGYKFWTTSHDTPPNITLHLDYCGATVQTLLVPYLSYWKLHSQVRRANTHTHTHFLIQSVGSMQLFLFRLLHISQVPLHGSSRLQGVKPGWYHKWVQSTPYSICTQHKLVIKHACRQWHSQEYLYCKAVKEDTRSAPRVLPFVINDIMPCQLYIQLRILFHIWLSRFEGCSAAIFWHSSSLSRQSVIH